MIEPIFSELVWMVSGQLYIKEGVETTLGYLLNIIHVLSCSLCMIDKNVHGLEVEINSRYM